MIDYCIDNEKNEVINRLRQNQVGFEGLNVLNMLNTSFFMFGSGKNNVVINNTAYGNAWLIGNIKTVTSADEEIAATCELSSQSIGVVDVSKFSLGQTQFNTSGDIGLLEYKPNYLKYEVNVSGPALAAFSEIYYPKGWVAKIDGTEVEYIRLNYILRGLEIPAGKHVIEFEFKPDSYFIGNRIMMASSGLLILLVLGALIRQFISSKKIINPMRFKAP